MPRRTGRSYLPLPISFYIPIHDYLILHHLQTGSCQVNVDLDCACYI